MYQEYLRKPWWELYECCDLLVGIIGEEGLYYSLDGKEAESCGITSFRVEALKHGGLEFEYARDAKLYKSMLNSILSAVEAGRVQSRALQLKCFKRPYPHGNLTYLICPYDAVVTIVMEGFSIPLELQKHFGLYLAEERVMNPSKSDIKQFKREADTQYLLHQYPTKNITQICEDLYTLKTVHGCDYQFESPTKARELVKSLQPHGMIPGIVFEDKGNISFDFLKLNIVLSTLRKRCLRCSNDEFLTHPLLKFYAEKGGASIEEIMRYSARYYYNF